MQNNISVIINGYDTHLVLEKVLWGYNAQTYRNFEMIIVCNNSTRIVEEVKAQLFYAVTCIDPDQGMGMQKALAACTTDYVIMASGSCIPRQDFIEQHIKYREEGYFLSGGVLDVDAAAFNKITKEDIYSGTCFADHSGIVNNGLTASLLNRLIPASAKWNAANASAWREDIGTVMDDDKRWNSRLGHNLELAGIKPRQIHFSTVCIAPRK
jgi:hypothetical protein